MHEAGPQYGEGSAGNNVEFQSCPLLPYLLKDVVEYSCILLQIIDHVLATVPRELTKHVPDLLCPVQADTRPNGQSTCLIG